MDEREVSMIYLESPSTDPTFNLALEEYAFGHLDPQEEYFMLWRNRPSVIIGKHQNAQQEVNLLYAEQHHIPVVRRLSGGGAVYHDLNNLNFTFIVRGAVPELSMERFAAPLLAACRRFGIQARIEGRNDVTADGRKFSGNARYVERGRTMHHGTILLQTDRETMEQVLTVSSDKIESKGIASVKSRVTSLSLCAGYVIEPDVFSAVLREEVFGTDMPHQYMWTEEDLRQIELLKQNRYATWAWNVGTFPVYEVTRRRRIEGCGIVETSFSVLGGRISEITLRGDFMEFLPVSELEEQLLGCRIELGELEAFLQTCRPEQYICGLTAHILARMLCGLL